MSLDDAKRHDTDQHDPEPDPTTDIEDEAAPPRLAPSLLRRAFYSVSVLLILAAGFAVPLPVVESVPGTPTEIAPLIHIDGAEVTDLTGTSSLLTISHRERSLVPALVTFFDPERTLHRVEEVFPTDVDRDEYHAVQREAFRRQFDLAAAVGARAAGVEVDLHSAVVVVDVAADGPAAGMLFPRDVIVAVDGQPLTDAAALQAITHGGEPGQQLQLTVVHDDQQRQVDVELGTLPGEEGTRLGVMIEDGFVSLELPFDVTLSEETRIGGPSAGLMVALTVYDLLSDEDLLQGRNVVGTGTIGPDGQVGRVGGIPQKMRSAVAHGADIALVPRSQLDIAQQAAGDQITIFGVRTLDEALDALRREPV